MLRITADIFSGRPNPVWDVYDEAEVRATLQELTASPDLLTDDVPFESGLGLRGFRLEVNADDLARDFGLGAAAYLPLGAQARGARSAEIAERLIDLTQRGSESVTADVPPLEASAIELLTAQLAEVSQRSRSTVTGPDPAGPAATGEVIESDTSCTIERGTFNPGFWNNDPNVRWTNNCYNYASNWRTNTFAQPGRGCGSVWTAITCAEVTRAALCDGMHRRFDCFPEAEKPRPLVALVVAPPPAFGGSGDYHWYRYQLDGFWGHKPGGGAARNTDESNAVIFNPQTANRGPYTQFCGYFYGCNSQRRLIR